MEKEKLDKTIKAGMENGLTADEWYVALITSIASSLAVIADKLTEKESQENFNKDSETESMLKADLIPRQNCKFRHENGNCLAVGGFCLSVDDEHCQYEANEEMNPYEKCKTCGQNRESCCGCPEVLELEQKRRRTK